MGVVFMVMGFIDHLSVDLSHAQENLARSRLTITLLVLGGAGFLAMFYYAGANSVPRRYAVYPQEAAQGALHARVAVGFISVLLAGILLYLWETGKRCVRTFSS